MELRTWLELNGIRKGDFAQQIGCKPSTLTALMNADCLTAKWVRRVHQATGGMVSPNDLFRLTSMGSDPNEDGAHCETLLHRFTLAEDHGTRRLVRLLLDIAGEANNGKLDVSNVLAFRVHVIKVRSDWRSLNASSESNFAIEPRTELAASS